MVRLVGQCSRTGAVPADACRRRPA